MEDYIVDYSPAIVFLQKKTVRIITNSSFKEHTSPIFKDLNFIKLCDLVSFQIALFMYTFYNQLLPPIFTNFFSTVASLVRAGEERASLNLSSPARTKRLLRRLHCMVLDYLPSSHFHSQ